MPEMRRRREEIEYLFQILNNISPPAIAQLIRELNARVMHLSPTLDMAKLAGELLG